MKIRVLYPCVNCKIKISSHQNLSFVSTQATDDHRTKMKTLQLVNWSTPPKLIIIIYYGYLQEYQLTCLMNPWIKLIHHLQTPKNGINMAKILIWKHVEKLEN